MAITKYPRRGSLREEAFISVHGVVGKTCRQVYRTYVWVDQRAEK